MQKTGKIKLLKPCPCCGNPDLYYGYMSSTSMGIECVLLDSNDCIKGCRLKISVEFPFDGTLEKSMQEIERDTLKEAINRWNRRDGC